MYPKSQGQQQQEKRKKVLNFWPILKRTEQNGNPSNPELRTKRVLGMAGWRTEYCTEQYNSAVVSVFASQQDSLSVFLFCFCSFQPSRDLCWVQVVKTGVLVAPTGFRTRASSEQLSNHSLGSYCYQCLPCFKHLQGDSFVVPGFSGFLTVKEPAWEALKWV